MSFKTLGLAPELLRGIEAAGYTTPTPIQERAIPIALAGGDIVGCAQTGTGKTASFVLPLLDRLMKSHSAPPTRGRVRALVLTPTRELALQVDDSVRVYGKFTRLRSHAIYGGVGYEPQINALRRGLDIAICTPGRLIDLLNRRAIDLSEVEVLVLDEADRMFDMGFINDVKKIVAKIPDDRQTLLFSATMSPPILELANRIQRNPVSIEVGSRSNPAESVAQHFYPVSKELKMELLLHIMESEAMESVLIFSRTKHGADRIAQRLERKGINAAALHSDRTQNQRQRALDGFKRGDFNVLVATDIAARGIDINGISHVINFDTPASPEDYIHRIGRTGRASMTGDAITFVTHSEEAQLKRVERHVGRRFERKSYPGFSYARRTVEQEYPAIRRSESPTGGNDRRSSGHGSGNGDERRSSPGYQGERRSNSGSYGADRRRSR
jgi:ATP-dependent RNA helicase RhlE